jgi:exonuclease VII small subunit
MKQPKFALSLAISVLILASVACGQAAPEPTAPPVDSQATVDAAIAATSQAQAALQATIDASVAATASALAAAAPTEAPPTAVPSSGETVEYVTMSEEELEALVNQSVAEATTATQQTSAAAAESAADDTLSEEELAYIYDYYYLAETSLAYAYEVMDAYYGLYADLAEEALDLLVEVEDDLDELTGSLDTMNASLEEISTALEQGVALAEESITQLETAAQEAQTKAAEAQTKTQEWSASAQAERDARAEAIANVQPDNAPKNFRESLQVTVDFMDAVKTSLADQKLSRDELDIIAQLGANASAGLQSFGDADFQQFSGGISQITNQLALGQIPHASAGLQSFELSLGDLSKGIPGGLPKPSRRK